MAITLNGTTGIQNVLGSASAPAESNTTSSNTGLYFPTSTTLGLSTAGTNALYVDASQNVGIGTNSPGNKLVTVSNSANSKIEIQNTSTAASTSKTSALQFTGTDTVGTLKESGDIYVNPVDNNYVGSNMLFYTRGSDTLSERMRIDSSGNLLVGTTSQIQSGKISFVGTCSGQSSTASFSANQTGTSGDQFYFRTSSGTTLAGYITCPTASTTSYVSASDYRLKENVIPINNGLTTISALKPVKYDWLTDKAQGEGFIAHELAEFIPMAVTGEKDAINEDGSIKPQGVDYSKIVVHLVAALQELDAKFEAYKAAHP